MHAEIAAGKPGIAEAAGGETAAQPGLSPDAEAEADGEVEAVERVFQLKDVNLEIPRNCFIAVVGEIGSGKSSLLSALFGEMRRTEGKVMFGGSSASCSQVPWICNATVRENILFGRPFDEERYWDVIHQACLETDLDLLPNGDAETIGEKGVNLSGGQKARVNIARAIYHQADITAFDDPLAAGKLKVVVYSDSIPLILFDGHSRPWYRFSTFRSDCQHERNQDSGYPCYPSCAGLRLHHYHA
jgi:ABC-type branched-subunit amino acid transport system ATPase component